MRKVLLICSLFLLGMACSKDEEIIEPEVPKAEESGENQKAFDHRVTVDEALMRAERSISRVATRSSSREVKSCEYYVAKPATRSDADTIEVAFYLVNYEDNAGFAMVSADERTTDVYAYSDVGQLTAEDLETHPGMSLFMEGAVAHYQNEVRALIAPPENPWPGDDPIGPLDPVPFPTPTLYPKEYYNGTLYYCKTEEIVVSTEPLTPFYWDQFWPYNVVCSPNLTGCGPTAMGKIMAYHEHPESFNGHIYDWDIMKKGEHHIFSSPGTNMISLLVCDIGQDQPSIKYNTAENGGTSTSFRENRETFTHFGYSCSYMIDFEESRVANNIDNRKPVWVGGQSSKSGHIWHIDAYQDDQIVKTYYKTSPPYALYHKDIAHTYYYRCIWGWDSLYYSYCLNSAFRGYNMNVKMICDITPIR